MAKMLKFHSHRFLDNRQPLLMKQHCGPIERHRYKVVLTQATEVNCNIRLT